MKTARTLGMSLRRFEGWVAPTQTIHRYDDSGRLAGSQSTSESEWDDDQQAWMVALAALEMDTCPGCGNRLSVTTATEAEGQYLPDKPSRCHCCDAVEIGVEQAKDNPRPRSLFHSAHRRE